MYTLASWVRYWIDTYGPLRSSLVSLERYRTLARYFETGPDLLRRVGIAPLRKLSHIALEAGLLALSRTGERVKQLSPKTIRMLGALIHCTLEKAFRLELIRDNPMKKVEMPRLLNREARFLNLGEILNLRRVCRGDWTFPFIELALATGARRGELLALQWADLDRSGRILTISKSIEQTKAGLRIKSPKSGKTRRCTLPHLAMEALGSPPGPSALIFPDPLGKHRIPAHVSQIIVRRLEKAGIQEASLHTLRHTHASALLSRGVPLPAVSVRLGHADTHVTARIYAHALPPDDARAADEWDQLLK